MKQLNDALGEWQELLSRLGEFQPAIERLAAALADCWKNKGKLLIAGNGGSAADAMHFAEELTVRYMAERRALAAVALCDPAVITCAGNDYGYETIFARQIEALGNPGDVLVVFSTSGNSPSILKAITAAQSRGLFTAAFLGVDGGAARSRCDVEMIVPSRSTARIQEAHTLLFHVLCDWADTACLAGEF
jgi:D-sedoheptulose 7-phosphate isomerase